MMQRVVFVEGLTGSGKSTTAHYIARQMRYNGIPGRWIHEGELDHPLSVEFEGDLSVFIKATLYQWKRFFSVDFLRDQVFVIEASYFNNLLETLLAQNLPRQEILDFALQLAETAAPANPVLIYLTQPNLKSALDENFGNRGLGFKNFVIDYTDNIPYVQKHGWVGESGMYAFWKDFVALTNAVFAVLEMPKLAVDVSGARWEISYQRINEALSLEMFPDPSLSPKEASRYMGIYRDLRNGRTFRIDYQDGVLITDLFMQVPTALVPVDDNDFEVAGWHFRMFFEERDGEFQRLHIGGADVDYLGLVGMEAEMIRSSRA